MSDSPRARLAALCLAAGRGARLEPITESLPKPLCPAGGDRLLSRAVVRAQRHAQRVVVNAHHLADQIVGFVADRLVGVDVSVEDRLLGTGGAVGKVLGWLGDDDLLIVNSDTVLVADTDRFVDTWSGDSLRLLVVADPRRPDFEGLWRYVGVALIPNVMTATFSSGEPAHLYDHLIAPQYASGGVELVPVAASYVDCATPADLLIANLVLSGGVTVVSEGASLEGTADHSLLLPGARVADGEFLSWSIRLADGQTIDLSDRFGGGR